MTHQYESEILNKLMERDGFNIPSSVPPYESEIKAYLIEQVKLAYPKLNDYEAEWLLYNYTKHLPAEFPIETITNVNNATVDNVVPYAYKSAILSGNTLVNLSKVRSASRYNMCPEKNIAVKPNTKYIALFNATYYEPENVANYALIVSSTVSLANDIVTGDDTYTYAVAGGIGTEYRAKKGDRYLIFTTKDNERYLHIRTGGVYGLTYTDMIILEYQDGMENWDIPYFKGMQSVKMPVLTTTGKNLFDGEYELDKHLQKDGTLVVSTDWATTKNYIRVKPNTTYTQNIHMSSTSVHVVFYDENKNIIGAEIGSDVSNSATATYTTPNNCYYIKTCYRYRSAGNHLFQVEEGTIATEYEPFKSNILTTSEEVELRGVGDVKDELNLLTGELTQRIGEVVLDGSEEWEMATTKTNTQVFQLLSYYITKNVVNETPLLCDTLKNTSGVDEECISFKSYLYIALLKTKASTIAELKSYLSKNPITFYHQTITNTVKTVDLSVVDENGNEINYFMPIEGTMHIQTDGEPIKPSVTMEIPVEATTQNLASFIEMEE